MLVTHQS